MTISSDNEAVLAGYTCEAMAYADSLELHISHRPDADLDGDFVAFCHDAQELIRVNGWLFEIEPVAQSLHTRT